MSLLSLASAITVAGCDAARPTADAQSATIEPTPAIDPRAKAIYDGALARIAALQSIEFTVRPFIGSLAASSVPPGFDTPASVAIDFAGVDAPHVVVRPRDTRAWEVVFDARHALFVDFDRRIYHEGGASAASVAREVSQSLPNWLLAAHEHALHPERAPRIASIAFVSEEEIDGVACDIVRVELVSSPAVRGEQVRDSEGKNAGKPAEIRVIDTVAIARVDRLPRRVESAPEIDALRHAPGVSTGARYTDLRVDATLDRARFEVGVPEGFVKLSTGPAASAAADTFRTHAGDLVPDFALLDLAGNSVSRASLAGKVVLLDFWATWCGPCKAAMPEVEAIYQQYKDRGVVVLGVNTWEKKPDAAKTYLAAHHIGYGCLLNGDKLAETCGITGIPAMIVVGRDGRVAYIGGPSPTLRETIDAALAK